MRLLKMPAVWIGGIVVAVLAAWLTGFFNQFLPAPERAKLAIQNLWQPTAATAASRERFRFVLCWLEGDENGRNTAIVAQAFTGIPGIELVRSARIVAAAGAADKWQLAMQRDAISVLDDWDADLAIVGLVKESGVALSLWFVPREGAGTLGRGDTPYPLENVSAPAAFHEDLRAQLAAVAVTAAAPAANYEARSRSLTKTLVAIVSRIEAVLSKGTVTEPARRADLYQALGSAQWVIGERTGSIDRLEKAVAAYTVALNNYNRELAPLDWAATLNNLGIALRTLGERERGTDRLKQAVAAHTAALEERRRGQVPLEWAATHNSLGNALLTLGTRERGTEHLEQAVAAYAAALEEYTREQAPLDWAATQNNLGNALAILGQLERGTERLEQAVATYTAALEEYTRAEMPLEWAATQNNLGNALTNLGWREHSTKRLKEAVAAYTAALLERTKEKVPLEWAATQSNLGNALLTLGAWEGGTERLVQAAAAYRHALEVFTEAVAPHQHQFVVQNLERCEALIAERRS